jgi:hypothetical protein
MALSLASLYSFIDLAHSSVSPPLFVASSIIYFFGSSKMSSTLHLKTVTPYLVVWGKLSVIAMLLSKAVSEGVRRGWIRIALEWIRFYFKLTWIKIILGLRYLVDSWLGMSLGLFAVSDLCLLLIWAHYNIDPLKWVRSTLDLIRSFFFYIRDPPALMEAFNTWKDSIVILGRVLRFGVWWIDRVFDKSRNGSLFVILEILAMTFILASLAVLAYALCNLRVAREFAARFYMPPPPPPAPEGGSSSGDDEDDNNNDSPNPASSLSRRRSTRGK